MSLLSERVKALSPSQTVQLTALLEKHGADRPNLASAEESSNNAIADRLQLVAYVVGDSHLDVDAIGKRIKQVLPDYMCPSRYITLESLPTLDNGKCDYARLPRPESVVGRSHQPTEDAPTVTSIDGEANQVTAKLIAILCDLLGTTGIRPTDNFFEIGGDSIVAIQLVSKAREAGIPLSVAAITTATDLSSLSATLIHAPVRVPSVSAFGTTPLTPIQSWFFSHAHPEPTRWNMGGVLELAVPVDAQTLRTAIHACVNRHPVLSSVFARTDNNWNVEISEDFAPDSMVTVVELDGTESAVQEALQLEKIQAAFDLSAGWLLGFSILASGSSTQRGEGADDGRAVKLCWAVHHLICDGLSVQILLDGIKSECQRLGQPETSLTTDSLSCSYREWAYELQSTSMEKFAQLADASPSGNNNADECLQYPVEQDCTDFVLQLDAKVISELQQANETYSTTSNELLLTAVASAWLDVFSHNLTIDVETHGRDVLGHDFDTSGVMGWFTTYFPVGVQEIPGLPVGERIKQVKESYRQSHENAGDYLQSRYGNSLAVPEIKEVDGDSPNLLFNFINTTSTGTESADATFWTSTVSSIEQLRSPRNHRSHVVELNALASRTQIDLRFRYVIKVIPPEALQQFANDIQTYLQHILDHCLNMDSTVYTPSDFPDVDMDQNDLDDFMSGLELD